MANIYFQLPGFSTETDFLEECRNTMSSEVTGPYRQNKTDNLIRNLDRKQL